MLSDDYVKEAVNNVNTDLKNYGRVLKNSVKGTMSHGYRPELDVSLEPGPDQANYYQNLIELLRWNIELGRIDIYTEVALILRYLAPPQRGHMKQVFHKSRVWTTLTNLR